MSMLPFHHPSDAEGDAARFLESEAAACELRAELAKQRAVSEQYRSEASNVPRLQVWKWVGGVEDRGTGGRERL